MIKRIFSVAALSLMVAACGGGDENGEVVDQDTSSAVIQGTDTVNQPTVVPTADTVTTTTTTTVDTSQGQAATGDTVRRDTAQH
ncbi:MAG TPA: hypothetical protein VHG08_03710 [Longimicrobium sp.]|nr:hypothetical protein [Longimicrobium sp.]